MEKATFAAGCFWGIEAAFRKLEGVTDVAVGYEGGISEFPTYQDVCTGKTGHAEVVEVDFDPTTLNRQGPDIGPQYRSAIFFHNDEQKVEAERCKSEEQDSGKHQGQIVTEITPHKRFYRAEEYHQQYFEKMGRH